MKIIKNVMLSFKVKITNGSASKEKHVKWAFIPTNNELFSRVFLAITVMMSSNSNLFFF